MQLVSKEQMNQMVFKQKVGYGRAKNPIVESLLAMAVGSSALVTKEEWRGKGNPASSLYNQKYKKFTLKSLNDGTGWVITRNA